MRFAVVISSFLAAGLLCGVAGAGEGSSAVAEAFCKTRIIQDEPATLALLTSSLQNAIKKAEARRDVVAKAAPNEKPPLGDGIPFQAFPDVPDSCKVGEVVEVGGRTEVKVSYIFPDAPDAGWTDRLRLVTENGKLRIDDVVYANVANGEPEYGLRRVLFDAFDQ